MESFRILSRIAAHSESKKKTALCAASVTTYSMYLYAYHHSGSALASDFVSTSTRKNVGSHAI